MFYGSRRGSTVPVWTYVRELKSNDDNKNQKKVPISSWFFLFYPPSFFVLYSFEIVVFGFCSSFLECNYIYRFKKFRRDTRNVCSMNCVGYIALWWVNCRCKWQMRKKQENNLDFTSLKISYTYQNEERRENIEIFYLFPEWKQSLF